MASESPPFWWRKSAWQAWILFPVSWIYGRVARYRLENGKRERLPVPVLCVGNFTVGGSGKTPVAMEMARQAKKLGLKPGFLSRGHGGSLDDVHVVDAAHDDARMVGDEPMLLVANAPVAVGADRYSAALKLIERGCDFLIMDDGFQSARLHTGHAMLVVDGMRGFGNWHVIPGGPLRAPVADQLRHADSILVVGEGDQGDRLVRQAARAGRPIHRASMKVVNSRKYAKRRFVAFCGIGSPEKFYASLRETGAEIAAVSSFGDHHVYSGDDISELRSLAARHDAELITTTKDLSRLKGGGSEAKALADEVATLQIRIAFDPEDLPRRIIEEMQRAR